MAYQGEENNSYDRRDHLRSFEEIGIGNPGRGKPFHTTVRARGGSNRSQLSETKTTRAQHIVKQAGGKLYIVKGHANTIEVRRTEFELQDLEKRKNLMNEEPIIIEFESIIAQGMCLQNYMENGDYTCSLFVPLVNNTIYQLFFTHDGLKSNQNSDPLVSVIQLQVPETPSSRNLGYISDKKLFRIETLFQRNIGSEMDPEYTYKQTIATSHGDDYIYIYNIPVSSIPTNNRITVNGSAIPLGTKQKPTLWSGIKDSLIGGIMSWKSPEETEIEVIEDLKYLNHNLMCIIVSQEDRDYEARLLNIYSGEILARLNLKEPQIGTSYKVRKI